MDQPTTLPTPAARAAEPSDRPDAGVGRVPESLLPPNTVKAGVVPEPRPASPAAVASAPAQGALAPEQADIDVELPPLTPQAAFFLTSEYYTESDMRLQKTFAVTDEDLSFFHEMDHLVLGGAIGVDGYIRALRGEFLDWEAATREKLIARLVADRFLPWDDQLTPSAKAAAAEAGLALPHTPYYRVYQKPLTYEQVADEAAKMVGIPFTSSMTHRLAALVKSRSKGVRVAEQAEAQLTRPLEQGGLGLEPEQARATVIAMGDLLKRVELTDGEERPGVGTAALEQPSLEEVQRKAPDAPTPQSTPRLSAPVAVPAQPVVLTFVPSSEALDIQFVPDVEEDAKEVAAIAKAMPRAANRAEILAQAVGAVMKTLTGTPEDPYLLRRLENIVSTRLRDVRSRNEVLSTLSRGQKVGGLGLGRAEAERLTQEIEAGYAEWHERLAAEESLAREQYTRDQAAKTEAQKKQEATEHAAWLAERARQQQVATQPFAQTAPVQPGGHPLDAREQAREEQSFGKLVDVPKKNMGVEDFLASLSASPAPTTVEKTTSKKSPAVPPPPVPKKSQSPAVKISAESVTDASTPARPRMDDVQEMRSGLVGPQQELERLTLGAFRRLGKTPEAAAAHIRNLVGLLQEQSFGKRVEGIQAWQDSPLQRQYVGLVAEAFSSGTPMKDLLAKKRTAGEDVPTDEELTAIVTLNGDLRL